MQSCQLSEKVSVQLFSSKYILQANPVSAGRTKEISRNIEQLPPERGELHFIHFLGQYGSLEMAEQNVKEQDGLSNGVVYVKAVSDNLA